MNENPTINNAFALKNYSQNGNGRSMKKFCEDEGYDYDKFLQYSRRGQKEFSVLKEADERQRDAGKFVQLVVDGVSENTLGILEVRVRFTNGMELIQGDGDINELLEWSRKCWDRAMVTMSSEYSIYLCRDKVDLRKGISGLSGIVRSEMKMNPYLKEI